MTEAEWLDHADWHHHFQFLGHRVSPRKQRLLAAALCRLAWDLFEGDPDCRAAVETAERYCEGRAGVEDLERCRKHCRSIAFRAMSKANELESARHLARSEVAWTAAFVVGGQLDVPAIGGRIVQAYLANEGIIAWRDAGPHDWARLTPLRARQRDALFDVVGNPFRPVALDPAWRTSTVLALTRPMLDAGDFTTMPLLADALQDAGCDDETVLDHCRADGPHFRGCWVVDGLLNRD